MNVFRPPPSAFSCNHGLRSHSERESAAGRVASRRSRRSLTDTAQLGRIHDHGRAGSSSHTLHATTDELGSPRTHCMQPWSGRRCTLGTSTPRSRPISLFWLDCTRSSASTWRMVLIRKRASTGRISMPPGSSRGRFFITTTGLLGTLHLLWACVSSGFRV